MCLRDKQDTGATLDTELTLGVNTRRHWGRPQGSLEALLESYALTFCSVLFLPTLPSLYGESFLFSMKRRSEEFKDRPTSCWQGPAGNHGNQVRSQSVLLPTPSPRGNSLRPLEMEEGSRECGKGAHFLK